MQELVNKVRTPADTDWKIGRKEPVRAFVEDSWHRGFAAKKKGQEFEVFLFDLGEMVTVKQENLKRLPDELTQVPPLAYQVMIAIAYSQRRSDFFRQTLVFLAEFDLQNLLFRFVCLVLDLPLVESIPG